MRFTVRMKLLIFAAIAWAVIFGAYGYYIYNERIAQTERMAISTARYLSSEIAATRQAYSAIVVPRAIKGGVSIAGLHSTGDSAMPNPNAFTREITSSFAIKGEFYVDIIGIRPINPISSIKDDFQKKAIEKFVNGAGSNNFAFIKYKDVESLRYMIPDIATSQTCVDCHNAISNGRTAPFKIGDVMGAIEIIVPVENEMNLAMSGIWRQIGVGFLVILAMGIAGFAYTRKVVTAPIEALADTSKKISGGDLTVASAIDSRDEIGELAKQTNEVIDNLHKMISEIRQVSSEGHMISEEVRRKSRFVLEGSRIQEASLDDIGAYMVEVDTSIVSIVKSTDSLAESMEKGASSVHAIAAGISEIVNNLEGLFGSVDEAAISTRDMSLSVKETSENIARLSVSVSEVTASMIEINASIKEVELNASEASRFAEEVIRDARAGLKSVESTIDGIEHVKFITRDSTESINALAGRIGEIGKILDVISEVAEETNLLALNAAIIAAQSGEHGKSFSVVANEIQDLAERTTSSAKIVSDILGAVEAESSRAVAAMTRGVEGVEQGVKLSREAGEGLRKIVMSAQRSTNSVREIARASGDQARQSRLVVESIENVAGMTRRIVRATQEQAKGADLINKASDRMADIAFKVKKLTMKQTDANKQISSTFDAVNSMVIYVNSVIREQGRATAGIIEAIEAVKKISVENTGKAMQSDQGVEHIAMLNIRVMDSVKRFKLKK